MTRHQATAWALLLVAAGLAGCIGGGDGAGNEATSDLSPTGQGGAPREAAGESEPGAGSADGPSQPVEPPPHLRGNLTLASCELFVGLVPLPEDLARDGLPSGWEPYPYQDLPLLYQGFVAASQCDQVNGTERDSVPMLMAGVLAEPPAEYRGPVDVHAVLVGMVLEDEDVEHQLRTWRVRSLDLGTVTASTTVTPAGAAAYFEASVGGWGVRFESVVPGNAFELGSTSMRLFDTSESRVQAALDVRWTTDAGFGPGEAFAWTGEAGLPVDPIPPGLGAFLGGTPDFGFTFEPAALPTEIAANATGGPGWPALVGPLP